MQHGTLSTPSKLPLRKGPYSLSYVQSCYVVGTEVGVSSMSQHAMKLCALSILTHNVILIHALYVTELGRLDSDSETY